MNQRVSHLGVSLGIGAVKRRQANYFITLQSLVADLSKVRHSGRFDRRLAIHLQPRLLTPDEGGSLLLDPRTPRTSYVWSRSVMGAAAPSS